MKIKESKLGGIYEVIDEDYLNHIREMQCCVDGCNKYASPHHIQSRKKGRRDDLVVPLCAMHHVTGNIKQAVHQMGQKSFQEKFNLDFEEIAEQLYREYTMS